MSNGAYAPKPGNRPKLGPVQGDPVTKRPDLAALTPRQRALRLAVIREFKAKKVRKFVEKHVEHLNTNQVPVRRTRGAAT